MEPVTPTLPDDDVAATCVVFRILLAGVAACRCRWYAR